MFAITFGVCEPEGVTSSAWGAAGAGGVAVACGRQHISHRSGGAALANDASPFSAIDTAAVDSVGVSNTGGAAPDGRTSIYGSRVAAALVVGLLMVKSTRSRVMAVENAHRPQTSSDGSPY